MSIERFKEAVRIIGARHDSGHSNVAHNPLYIASTSNGDGELHLDDMREVLAEVERLRLALRGLLREVEGGEHHPEECPRSSACEEPGEQGCRRCKSYDCPECECGLSETLRAMAAAREALAWSGAQPSET